MAQKFLCVYLDMLPALEGLDYPEVGRLIIAALKYARDGEQPASLKGKETVLWPVFMSQIDRNRESYKVRCEINRNNALSKANRTESLRIVANRNNRIEENKTEQNKTEEKRKKGAKPDDFAEFAGDNADLLKALRDFSAMRSQIRKPLTPAARARLLSRLKKDFSPAEWVPVLNQSVDHCWQDLYPLKKDEPPQPRRTSGKNVQTTPAPTVTDQISKYGSIGDKVSAVLAQFPELGGDL